MTEQNTAQNQTTENTAGAQGEVITLTKAEIKELFGKEFTSKEDIAKSYKEAERAFHGKAEEASKFKTEAERWKAATAELVSIVDRKGDGQGDNSQNDAEQLSQRLYHNPAEVLEQTKKEAATEGFTAARKYYELRETVKDFVQGNAEIAQHPQLFTMFLSHTNPALKPEEKLAEALKATKEYIVKIREEGKNTARQEEAEQRKVAEGVSGESVPAKKAEEPQSTGNSFDDYMAERRAALNRTLGLL